MTTINFAQFLDQSYWFSNYRRVVIDDGKLKTSFSVQQFLPSFMETKAYKESNSLTWTTLSNSSIHCNSFRASKGALTVTKLQQLWVSRCTVKLNDLPKKSKSWNEYQQRRVPNVYSKPQEFDPKGTKSGKTLDSQKECAQLISDLSLISSTKQWAYAFEKRVADREPQVGTLIPYQDKRGNRFIYHIAEVISIDSVHAYVLLPVTKSKKAEPIIIFRGSRGSRYATHHAETKKENMNKEMGVRGISAAYTELKRVMKDKQWLVIGMSMGGSHAEVLAATPLKANIRKVITVCSAGAPEAVVARVNNSGPKIHHIIEADDAVSQLNRHIYNNKTKFTTLTEPGTKAVEYPTGFLSFPKAMYILFKKSLGYAHTRKTSFAFAAPKTTENLPHQPEWGKWRERLALYGKIGQFNKNFPQEV